jgi:hypothetical protein
MGANERRAVGVMRGLANTPRRSTDEGTIILHRFVPARDVALRQVRRNLKGRHGAFDRAHLDAVMKGRWDEQFALASIPLDALNFQDVADADPARIARAERYARMDTPLPPALATYRGGRRASGRAWVTDGNHRVLAAAMRGNHAALVYIPLADLFRLRDDAIRLGLATSMVSAAKVSRVRNPARRPKKRTTR